MTFLSAFILHRPALHTVAQGLMAVFYTFVFPMSFRIRRGFYASGIWAEHRFLPYQEIRWLGWRKGRKSCSLSAARNGFFGRATIIFAYPVTTTVRRVGS